MAGKHGGNCGKNPFAAVHASWPDLITTHILTISWDLWASYEPWSKFGDHLSGVTGSKGMPGQLNSFQPHVLIPVVGFRCVIPANRAKLPWEAALRCDAVRSAGRPLPSCKPWQRALRMGHPRKELQVNHHQNGRGNDDSMMFLFLGEAPVGDSHSVQRLISAMCSNWFPQSCWGSIKI